MGGGGSALAMIQTIKYNKSLLKGPKTYSTLNNYMQSEYDCRAHRSQKAYQGKEVPAEELAKIKQKIKEDLRAQRIRSSILIYSFTVIVIVVFYWAIFV
jgi:hypothetical protein